MQYVIKNFGRTLTLSAIGIMLGGVVAYLYTGTWIGVFQGMLVTFALAALEFSISLDNAIVNATVLRHMNAKWRHRFLTWGILIAVFGMRVIFPLVVVSAMTFIGPWDALVLAATNPDEYARIMSSAHVNLAGFGASFLLLVALRYFLDDGKEVHWFDWLERPLSVLGRVMAADILLCVLILVSYSAFLPAEAVRPFLVSAAGGIALFIAIHSIMRILKVPEDAEMSFERSSAMMFIYLEALDASFSLDGVIGAFAVTNNLFIIAIGLGIGALFVRTLTVMLVEQKALEEFRYLEHGAFYAVGSLAIVMLLDLFIHIPEVIIGLMGIAIIGMSLLSSLRHRRQESR